MIHKKIKDWEDNVGPELMKTIGIKDTSIVMDLGCGFAHYAIASKNVVGPTGKVVAIDSNKRVLGLVKNRFQDENIKGIELKVTPIETLTEEDFKPIDFILLYDLLHGNEFNRYEFLCKIRNWIKSDCIVSILPFHLSNFRDREGKKKKYTLKKIIEEMNMLDYDFIDSFDQVGIHFEKYHSPHIMQKGELTFEELEVGTILNFKRK
ncbi:MAG: class I SAM-dependent methyltransferase [Clostridiales bacterium]|nr:class I SAM-dependent methyltransferase [Clostridiales bacterium]